MSLSTKNLIIGIVIGSIVGLAVGHLITWRSMDLTSGELQAQINGLEDEIYSKSAEIDDLQSQLDEKKDQIAERDSEIASLQSQVLHLEEQLGVEILGIYFSPRGGCEDELLYWISRANQSLHILIYSFTLDSIGNALVQAHNRLIEVQVVFETSQISQYSEYQALKDGGVTVRTDTNSDFMHNKVMIVDGIVVLTGSFNWSSHAENENNENLIVIEGIYVASIYEREFTKIWDESQQP